MKQLKDLVNLDISKLTKQTIKEYTNIARSAVNKSLKRWESKEFKSPAYYGLKSSGGKISFKGKDTLQQQKKELARAINFLQDPSRTVAGWNRIKQQQTEKINRKIGKTVGSGGMTPNDYDRLYSAFEKAAELNPNIAAENYKYNIMEALIEEIHADADESKTAEELAVDMDQYFREVLYPEAKDAEEVERRENISEDFY